MGFEKLHPEDTTEFIAYFTTIANNTDTELEVEQGGIAVDGHLVVPVPVGPNRKKAKKKGSQEGPDAVDFRNLRCLNGKHLSGDDSLSPQSLPAVTVAPQTSSTLSGVIRDPRHYPLLCSADGCFPKGTIRYSVRVGGHEYIFTWDGHSLVNCGK